MVTVSGSKKIGFEDFSILGVNLTNYELKKLGFFVKEGDEEKDRSTPYLTEREGIDQVELEFALKSDMGYLKKLSIFIKDKYSESKTGKFEYTNDRGGFTWAEDIESLPAYFKGKGNSLNPRKSRVGEKYFTHFLRNALKNKNVIMKFDIAPFFKGNIKELINDLKSGAFDKVIVANTIQVSTEGKEYEKCYTGAFASGEIKDYDTADVKRLLDTKEKNVQIGRNNKTLAKEDKEKYIQLSSLDELVLSMVDPGYPCKDIFYLGKLKDYHAEEYFQASNTPLSTEV